MVEKVHRSEPTPVSFPSGSEMNDGPREGETRGEIVMSGNVV